MVAGCTSQMKSALIVMLDCIVQGWKENCSAESVGSIKMMRLFSMFSGMGGFEFALKKAGIEFEVVGYSETDKFAIKCYEQNHHNYEKPHKVFIPFKIKNYGDCSKIIPEEVPDFDLLTAGFPCTDASIAGDRDLSKGRTMLVNDVFRIAKVKKPKYIIMENVRGLLSVDDGKLWDSIKYTLKKLGYDVRYKLLNSKHHGIPQNRERIFILCNRDGWEPFKQLFPHKEKLKITVKDILEENVDKKYYLSKKQVNTLMHGLQESKINPDIASSLQHPGHSGGNYKGMNMIQVADYRYDEGLRIRKDGCSPCLAARAREDGSGQPIIIGDRPGIFNGKTIRRLTPRECFRLQGDLQDEIDLKGISDSQCYKLAGNGIDINLVSKIFKCLFG